MPLQATSGAASYDAFGGGVAAVPNYIEDVFSTWLYTDSGSTQTINNGIDLAGKGGLVWVKSRSAVINNLLWDSARGTSNYLVSNNTGTPQSGAATTFNSNGFSVPNISTGATFASWTFREQPKFFDVVTFTTNSSGNANFTHNLGSTPGCIMLKTLNITDDWYVWHRSLGNNKYLQLNTTIAEGTATGWCSPTSTNVVTANGFLYPSQTYVAYLFAHNAGGFGLSGTDNVISCGSFTTNSSGQAGTINLGYEPQWVLFKQTNGADGWYLMDNMRGFTTYPGQGQRLFANTSGAESSITFFGPNATGFQADAAANATYIYIAIRRGPMRTPTTGTSVYNAVARTGTGSAATVTAGFPIDLLMVGVRNQAYGTKLWDRLRGIRNPLLNPTSTSAEYTGSSDSITAGTQTGITVGADSDWTINKSGDTYVNWFFGRAPGFFDEFCYTGTGSAPNDQPHNLGVAPELMILKRRSATSNWPVYTFLPSLSKQLSLNLTDAATNHGLNPTATTVNVQGLNISGATHVAYLFASCPGVSKVGSYTGTGTTQTINCGFTAGSRFVLIKRTDSTGDWYVWDSARGIVAGNDPYLLLNSTAAEVTNTDFIDTASTGFEISSTAPAAINASGGTFIFLAIA